MNTDAV